MAKYKITRYPKLSAPNPKFVGWYAAAWLAACEQDMRSDDYYSPRLLLHQATVMQPRLEFRILQLEQHILAVDQPNVKEVQKFRLTPDEVEWLLREIDSLEYYIGRGIRIANEKLSKLEKTG